MTILDVQRAGQILNLMLEPGNKFGVTVPADAMQAASFVKTFYPVDAQNKPTVQGYVDWKLVDALRPEAEKNGSPNKYLKMTTAQAQKPPVAKKKPVTVKPPKPATATWQGKQVKVKATWQVAPNQTVSIVERESA
jgi:hypothetical protein